MSSKFLHVLWCDLQVYKNVKDEECDMCHTVITEILNVLKDKINQVILRNCCVHFRLKLVGWRSVICVKRSCQRSGTWTATVLTRYIQQLLGYHEVLVWDIKSHALSFSLLYRLLNLLFNASNFFFPGKNQSLHQDRVVWKTWFISRSSRCTHFFENKICIRLKLLRVLNENCSSTMFLCYLFQCKTAVDEYADILFELIANELVIYYSVLQNIVTYKMYMCYMILEFSFCLKETVYLTCYICIALIDVLCYSQSSMLCKPKLLNSFLGPNYSVYNAWIL